MVHFGRVVISLALSVAAQNLEWCGSQQYDPEKVSGCSKESTVNILKQ